MYLRADKRRVSAVLVALLLISAAALGAGCGGKEADAYTGTVLAGWSRLEDDGGRLVEAAGAIEDKEGMGDFAEALAYAREAVTAFAEDVGRLEAPASLRESHELLKTFLASYGAYLVALERLTEVFAREGEISSPSDLEALAEEAEKAMRDYLGSQEYNTAGLVEGVWGLPGALGRARLAVYGGDAYRHALKVLEAWYDHFNRGEGEAMYGLLDAKSPMRNKFSRESFLNKVKEAHEGGLRAEYSVDGVESNSDDQGDWVTLFLTVRYFKHPGAEKATAPARSEYVFIDFLNREDGFLVYEVYSESAIW